ncbi:hypothetical protein RND81_04G224400 [Saponaria officinalis]|uniref:Uncharacterized protein n=1 Tax=Saponaria officinalis TaxID=3572 RepID=A0AAW1LQE2_SAPOF
MNELSMLVGAIPQQLTDSHALVGKSDDVKLTLNNPRDDDNNSDIDDGRDGAELLAAAEEGRGAGVLSILVKNPALIRTGDFVGNTVLHMAARDGDIVTVCNLIAFLEERQDEDLEKVLRDVNADGDTALHLGLKNRHPEVVYHLIKAEMWAETIRNNDGITTYVLPMEGGFNEACELSADGLTGPELYRAISMDDEDTLITGLRRNGKELLWHKDHRGETLLHAAVTASGMRLLCKLVQFMISNGLTDAALLGNREGSTALHLATEFRKFSKAICLIKAEPTAVYQVNNKGVSPLYLAVKFRHEDLVKLMVTQSRLLPWESEMRLHPKHATLAHLAIKARSLGILKLLLKHLPELIKGKNEKGWRPLSYAINKGYLDGVTYLLTNFPKSADKCDEDGSFPIHKAVGGGHVSIVKAFYKHCPQTLYHIDRKGRNVLHIAVSYDRADIVTYLTKELKWDDSLLNLKDNKARGVHRSETGPDWTERTRRPDHPKPLFEHR